ncbi:MAG: 23S rRNA (guanosine(2251)-2'-O)-methyltransferase RlmB [Alphaproteobacteria bacterium]
MTINKNYTSYNKKLPKSLWIYGKHCVISALNNINRKLYKLVLINEKSLNFIKPELIKNILVKIDPSFFTSNTLPNGAVHQGIALEASYLNQPAFEELVINSPPDCLLLLDQITDPHNVGAIIRSSAAFGAGAVITTFDNSPEESSTLIKSSAGNFEILPYIKVVNLRNSINFLKTHGYWCIGLDSNTDSTIDSTSFAKKTAFILGAEDTGLRKLTKENCDMLIKLPISASVDSLNVSNAAAITLYEYRKQYKF